MKTLAKIAIGIAAAIGVAYVAVSLLASFEIIGTRCHGGLLMVAPSPSNTMFARIETVTCGDDPMETRVSLSKDASNRVGSVSTYVFNAQSAMRAPSGEYSPLPLTIRWLRDGELEIGYPKDIAANASAGTFDGVKVSFRER